MNPEQIGSKLEAAGVDVAALEREMFGKKEEVPDV